MRKLSICTLALCLGFASIGYAATVTKSKVKGNSASGGASTVEDPCFNASISVQAFDQVSKDNTSTTVTKEISVFFFGNDSCKSLNYNGFSVVPLTFNIANQSTVTLPFDFTVDVTPFDSDQAVHKRFVGSATITATGDFEKSRQVNTTQDDNMRQVVRTKGTTRDATLTVTAKLGGTQLNFTPNEFAEIGTTKSGTIETTQY